MTIEKANPITGYDVTLMPPTPTEPVTFGWIRLANGEADAGYIYLMPTPRKPSLSHDGSYIVTAIPISEIQMLLHILDNQKNLQIRYFNSETPGKDPSVFIESFEEQINNVAILERIRNDFV